MMPGLDAKPLKRSTARQVDRSGSGIPTGVPLPYCGTSAPSGYLLCDGAAVSRTRYSYLFAVIGTTFGVGDGSTTFNVPNLQNRMPIGAGGLYSVGATGGSKDAIVVAHIHTATTAITDPGHTHSGVVGNAATGDVPAGGTTVVPTGNNGIASSATGITAATTVNSTGASGTDANLPPYLATHWIIKT
jgi:microcystin-dependent protein